MKYLSTRDDSLSRSFNDILYQGLSRDGGLYLPHSWPKIDLLTLKNKSYEEVACEIIFPYVNENIEKLELQKILNETYANFNHEKIAPLVELENNKFLLELIYGPTYAFKDYALQFLGNLFSTSLDISPKKITILGATSGDTGSAAIHSFKSKKDINVFILHPHNKVSPIQQKQMTTVIDKNIFNIAIDGNFDDCQKIVKELFVDDQIQQSTSLTAVNSINWARLIAQVVYYFWAYLQTDKQQINFIVPSGNFGNIFSAFVAKQMGLPIGHLHIATNSNDILKSIVDTGEMKKKSVSQTYSPSMDIQVSSNFERLLFYILNEDDQKVASLMKNLKDKGSFKLSKKEINEIKKDFKAEKISDNETLSIIQEVYDKEKFIIDPHTATAVGAIHKIGELKDTVVLGTAHPYKFLETVKKATGENIEAPYQLEKFIDKEEKFDIIENKNDKIKNYILSKIK